MPQLVAVPCKDARMREVWITPRGAPETLHEGEAPGPQPGPGEVRVYFGTVVLVP
jgi:hypothetical protein